MTTNMLDRLEASLRLPSSGLKTLPSPTLRLHSSIIIHHQPPLFTTNSNSLHLLTLPDIYSHLLESVFVFRYIKRWIRYQTRVALPCSHCRFRKLNCFITEITTEKLLNIVDTGSVEFGRRLSGLALPIEVDWLFLTKFLRTFSVLYT